MQASGCADPAIFLLIIATFLTISSLISYSRQRNNYPAGMTIGGVPVGGLDPQAASQRVLQVYTSPIEIRYGAGIIQVEPSTLGFELEIEFDAGRSRSESDRRAVLERILGLSVEPQPFCKCRSAPSQHLGGAPARVLDPGSRGALR